MFNNMDQGLAEDFDNMTLELGRQVIIKSKDFDISSESQETDETDFREFKEIVYLQELDSKNEVVSSGKFSVGDVRIFFKADTKVQEEYFIIDRSRNFKVLELTKVEGSTGKILYVKAYGKKVPLR